MMYGDVITRLRTDVSYLEFKRFLIVKSNLIILQKFVCYYINLLHGKPKDSYFITYISQIQENILNDDPKNFSAPCV